MSEDRVAFLGWVATATATIVYLSYMDQIAMNLAGARGSLLQPLMTVLNCGLWCIYGVAKDKRDWPIFIANIPGVAMGTAAFLSACYSRIQL